MLQLKTKQTKKKFYGKWLYKVSVRVGGAGMFRNHSVEDLIHYESTNFSVFQEWTYAQRSWKFRHEISAMAKFLDRFDAEKWAKRIEHDVIDFYTNDIEFYNALSAEWPSSIVHRFEPVNGLDFDKSTIIVNKFPHDRYRYRVYLLPHKLADRREEKAKFIDWVKGQSPRISMSPAIQSWFMKTDFNWDRRYVLVEDEQTLLMMKLRNGEVMGRVYNFTISDK